METRKSIRDIGSSDSSADPIIRRTRKAAPIPLADNPIEKSFTANPPRKTNFNIAGVASFFRSIRPAYLIGAAILLIIVLVLIFMPGRQAKDPAEQAKAEAEVVKKQLSKHMILPQNEEIDIRKITSAMEDPFFKDAEVGDYLVIFYKNRIAYIYSVKKDIIVNAGVVFIDPKTATTTSTTSKTQ